MKFLSIFLSFLLFFSCISKAPRTRGDEVITNVEEEKIGFVLTSSVPMAGAVGVAKNSQIILTFSKPLLNEGLYAINLETATTLPSWTIAIRDAVLGSPVFVKNFGSGSSLSQDKKTLTLRLAQELADRTTYTVTINSNLRADDEVKTSLGNIVEVRFTTLEEAPKVIAGPMTTSPDQEISVTFSKPMRVESVVTNKANDQCGVTSNTGPAGEDGASTSVTKRGIHLTCDGGKTCIPMRYIEPNGGDRIFTLKSKEPLPFNAKCKIMVSAEDMVDQSSANEGKGAKLQASWESNEVEIDGFTISGKILYGRIKVNKDKLDYDTVEIKSTPPLRVQLVDETGANGTIYSTFCTWTAIGCAYQFADLKKGHFRLNVDMEIPGSVYVYDSNGNKRSYTVELSDIEGNQSNADVVFRDNDINNVDGNARPVAVLDTLWHLYQAVFGDFVGAPLPLNVYWGADHIAVSDAQVNLRSNRLPGTFVRWHPVALTTGELYLVGNREVDSDEYDQMVIVREWLRLYLDKKMRVDAKIRHGSFGMGLDPRVALYEGLLSGLAASVFNDTNYGDSGGLALDSNGSGWNADLTADDKSLPLWMSGEKIARFLYHFAARDSSYLTAYLKAIEELKSSAHFNTVYTFLAALSGHLTSGQKFELIAASDDFAIDFEQALEQSFGEGESYLYDGRTPFVNITLDAKVEKVKMGSYSHHSLMGSIYSNAFVKFNGNGKELTFEVDSVGINIDIYKMSSGAPSLEYSNVGTGSQSVIFDSQIGIPYVAILSAVESEGVVFYPEDLILKDVGITINSKEPDTSRIGFALVNSSSSFSIGKASLPGKITFERKEGSNKLTVNIPPIMAKMNIQITGIGGVTIIKEESSRSDAREVTFSGHQGYIVVTAWGTLNGKNRKKSVAYAL